MRARYHFVTEIDLTSDRQEIWGALSRSEEWAHWWQWLETVEILDAGGDHGVGRRVCHVVTSPLRYRLSYIGLVTEVSEPDSGRFETEGDLVGTGRFTLEPRAGGTHLRLDWRVETPKIWMRLLAPLAKPLFVWSHHRLMTDFARGLAQATSGRLGAVANRSVPPGEGDDVASTP